MCSEKVDETRIRLNNGRQMPLVGLGTSRASAEEVEKAVEGALRCGYGHIDTAYFYGSEKPIGRAIRKWSAEEGGKREDLFIVTKLPGIGMEPSRVERFLRLSLCALNLQYVDLYLVHTPIGFKEGKDDNDLLPIGEDGKLMIDESTDLIAIWKVMEKMVECGLTKSIGVSNFNIRQLKKICANSRILPTVNQVEVHVYYQQNRLREFCKERNIIITAFFPLGSPGRVHFEKAPKIAPLLDDPVVKLVAQNHRVSEAQILIRFLIQSGITTIPKSSNHERIKMNIDVFDFQLTDIEMEALKSLDKGAKAATFTLDQYSEFRDHPEYPFIEEY